MNGKFGTKEMSDRQCRAVNQFGQWLEREFKCDVLRRHVALHRNPVGARFFLVVDHTKQTATLPAEARLIT